MKPHVFKVKRLQEWLEWCEYLKAHESEVLATLKSENATREAGVLFNVGEETYLVGWMEFDGVPTPSDKTVELNRLHKEKVDSCLERVSVEVCMDFFSDTLDG